MTEPSPTYCPGCASKGPFDGQGRFTRSFERHRSGEETPTQVVQTWTQLRCGECGTAFRVLDDEAVGEDTPRSQAPVY
jgi:hypothetical protein